LNPNIVRDYERNLRYEKVINFVGFEDRLEFGSGERAEIGTIVQDNVVGLWFYFVTNLTVPCVFGEETKLFGIFDFLVSAVPEIRILC
jgi:hypothetical protein